MVARGDDHLNIAAPAEGQPEPRKLLLVASVGGHLAQLHRLAPGLGATPDSLWVTFDSAQSRSLLHGRRRLHVPYVRPRDVVGVVRTASIVRRILRRERFDGVVSTGSAVALSAMSMAARAGIPGLYIESVSRVDGPSLSGRILAATRLAELRTQHARWAVGQWGLHPSVLSTYSSGVREPSERPSLFVTLGTIQGYRFDAVIDAVLATGLADDRTVWQTGYTVGRTDLPGTVHEQMSAAEFRRAALAADVVISHAGVGSVLTLLDAGVFPVLVTRRRSRREHVDDHQLQIAELAADLGVALAVDAPELTTAVIRTAAGRTIETVSRGSLAHAR